MSNALYSKSDFVLGVAQSVEQRAGFTEDPGSIPGAEKGYFCDTYALFPLKYYVEYNIILQFRAYETYNIIYSPCAALFL